MVFSFSFCGFCGTWSSCEVGIRCRMRTGVGEIRGLVLVFLWGCISAVFWILSIGVFSRGLRLGREYLARV